MDFDSRSLAGLGLLALLTISPGADMALVATVALRQGRRSAFFATLGITSGLLVHATASALGLSVILATSAEAFTAMKIVGAGYLGYLGIRALLSSRGDPPISSSAADAVRGHRSGYVRGLLNNVLNPKVAVFYLTFLPQFIAPTEPVLAKSLLFALAHAAMGIVWLTAYAYGVSRLAQAAATPSFRVWLERVTGVVLVGLGVRLAFERR